MSKDVVSKFGVALAGLSGVALFVALGSTWRQVNAAPVALPAPPSSHAVPYTASRFPGVQVRQIPEAQPAPDKNAAAWLGKRHGAASPRGGMARGLTEGNASTILRTGRGTTPAGGKWVEMPLERVPFSVAKRQKGKIAVDCIVPSAKVSKPPAKQTR